MRPEVIKIGCFELVFVSLSSCLINRIHILFGLFLGPVIVITCFNLIIFILVIRVLYRLILTRKYPRPVPNQKKILRMIKVTVMLCSRAFMFGLPWLIGALLDAEAYPVFRGMFFASSLLQCIIEFYETTDLLL